MALFPPLEVYGLHRGARGRLVSADYLIHKNVPFETSNGASELCDARKSRRETERDAKQFHSELLWPNALEMLW